jgi:hypothetical protein
MDCRIFELEFVRLESVLKKLRGTLYPDFRFKNYLDTLHELTEKVKLEISDSSFSTYSQDKLSTLKEVFRFIEQNIEFLDDSTLNIAPFETVYCLEKALKDWTNKDFLIVTSLQYNTYFFCDYLAFNDPIYSYLELAYQIKFDLRLIQISIPKYASNNYLLNVVLYHELGHFIDREYKISDRISDTEKSNYYNPSDEDYDRRIKIRKNHIAEYFADIFAAQYIKDSASNYLNYLAYNDSDSDTHPATSKRISIVRDFISGDTNNNIDLKTILESTKKVAGRELVKRCEELKRDDFENYIPVDIQNEMQLHGLFILGWNLWLNPKDEMELFDLYRIINNLIEKSISNFMIVTKWRDVHVSTQ